jgi:uncharacterized small protein (DUF1192 family)
MAKPISEKIQLLEAAILQLLAEKKRLSDELSRYRSGALAEPKVSTSSVEAEPTAVLKDNMSKMANVQVEIPVNGKNGNTDLKEQINVCIKEIERCIAQLND